MKRSIESLTQREFDIVVIGGGIYGACVAWDASLRGLSVALVEKGDFGHATSANSLKIVHGGLRYLQDGNLRLMRVMIQERSRWLQAAPHLVHPLPFVVPTGRTLTRNKLTFAAALALNDLMGFDRNRSEDPQKHLPPSRIISRQDYLRLWPNVNGEKMTGGALWYDAMIRDTERLLLSVIRAAVANGAVVANYLEAVDFLMGEAGVRGIVGHDRLTDQKVKIRGHIVINCAGPWTDEVLEMAAGQLKVQRFRPSTAINLVTRQLASGYAMGIPSGGAESRLLFIVPWRGYSLIGTWHDQGDRTSPDYPVPEEMVCAFISEINAAYPAALLDVQDVYHVHWGLLPQTEPGSAGLAVELMRESQVHDHTEEGVRGLLSVVGVKYTSARATAEKAVGRAAQMLGRAGRGAPSDQARVFGGAIEQFAPFLEEAQERRPQGLSPAVMEHLVYTYGAQYPRVVDYVRADSRLGQTLGPATPVIAAEVVHAVREEMAQSLGDVMLRRTPLGSAGLPDDACLRACASVMAEEFGWGDARCRKEVETVHATFRRATPWRQNRKEAR